MDELGGNAENWIAIIDTANLIVTQRLNDTTILTSYYLPLADSDDAVLPMLEVYQKMVTLSTGQVISVNRTVITSDVEVIERSKQRSKTFSPHDRSSIAFPNPTNGLLHLPETLYSTSGIQRFSIMNLTGRIQQQGILSGPSIDARGLLPGMYILQIHDETDGGSHLFRFNKID